MTAIIQTGGKQYDVQKGTILNIELLPNANPGDKYTFDQVLATFENGELVTGAPYIDGAKVEAKVIENGRGKKIKIYKYKPKKGSTRKRMGHRQPFTKVEITKISA
ncbi:MAG: 50S ribosomal protein L21 [Clostridiales bacterium]|nr:50S ribosomal protein L21 [Clostridiales bacterium]